MKKGLKTFLIIMGALLMTVLIVLMCNKTFFKGKYEGIPIPRGSYYINHNTLYSIRSYKSIDDLITKYINNLSSCYDDGYFYDKDLDISIIKYDIDEKETYRKITLDYEKGNVCDREYVLNKGWYNDIKVSDIQSEELTKCKNNDCKTSNTKINIDLLLNTIKNSERIENKEFINFDYKDNNNYLAIYLSDDKTYGIAIKVLEHDGYLTFIELDGNDNAKNALYKIDKNVNKFILELTK